MGCSRFYDLVCLVYGNKRLWLKKLSYASIMFHIHLTYASPMMGYVVFTSIILTIPEKVVEIFLMDITDDNAYYWEINFFSSFAIYEM